MKLRLDKARMLVRREMETTTFWGSLIVGLLATLVSLAVVDAAFSLAVHEVLAIGDGQRGRHYHLPSHIVTADLICFFVGITTIVTKKWVLPLVAGLFLEGAIVFPMYGGSVPSATFMFLSNLHMELLGVALVLNVMLAAIWIRESRRSSSGDSPIHVKA